MGQTYDETVKRCKELEARVAELEGGYRTWQRMMANPKYDLGEMASEFNAIAEDLLRP
jgi:hypothetical protein